MCKGTLATIKLNLKNLQGAYWGAGVTIGVNLIITILLIMLMRSGVLSSNLPGSDLSEMGSVGTLSIGNALWLFLIIAAVQISKHNFQRIINLGGKRDHFFWGSLPCYIIIAGVVSLGNTLLYYTFDAFLLRNSYFTDLFNGIEVFGWVERGVVAVIFQQFAFLLLLAVFIHTLAAVQDKWFGWVANVTIIAVITIFTIIASLRAHLASFFRLIIFEGPLLQITACIILALVIYSLNKVIFAQKAV